MLARLAPKQQALIFGHAVPMPVAFQPREYGSAKSYKDFTSTEASGSPPKTDKEIEKTLGNKGSSLTERGASPSL